MAENLNLDDLDDLVFSRKPEPSKERWVSWEEWQWGQIGKIMDEARIKAGKRPMPKKYRDEDLEKRMNGIKHPVGARNKNPG